MARKVSAPNPRPPLAVAVAVAGVVIVLLLVGAMLVLGGQRNPSTSPNASRSPGASSIAHSAGPSALSSSPVTPEPNGSPSSRPAQTPGQQTPQPTVTPMASATPATRPPASMAPQSAAEFDVHGQVIDIGFPLRADTDYHYRDNWYERRAGPPDPYNHAKAGPDGELVRLHDGIDLYAPEGEPVLAPFDGVVIDPASKWTPWKPDRYGLTVVIESDEPGTAGYTAVLVHLDKVWVDVGQHVTRGQVIGALGRTGDAQDVRPQLHFELRAPFLIDWSELGENRQVDAFNPYPSLVAADPNPAAQGTPQPTPQT